MNAAALAERIGGRQSRKSGGGFLVQCPAHADTSPSLSIDDGDDGRLLVRCFAGCSQERVIDALRSRRLWNGGEPAAAMSAEVRAEREAGREAERARLAEMARRIWAASLPPAGSPVETYLRARGIAIPIPPSLRYHPNLLHKPTGLYLPAMVAAVQIEDREAGAVHRTFLRADGRDKAPLSDPRMMLGSCLGAAVRLAAATDPLAVSEGIETGLSAMQATGWPVWAALSTAGLASLVLPERIRSVMILADNDAPGEKAARAAAARWAREGRAVLIARPPAATKDFNDALREAAMTEKDIVEAVARAEPVNGAEIAKSPAGADEIRLMELASLSLLEYDRIREDEAKKLKCRVSVLDILVEKRRPKLSPDADPDPFGWNIEPASEPVDGGELLDDLVAEFSERVILPKHGAEAMALWTLHSWTIDAAYFTPLLMLASPEMRCGKTSALAAIGRVVPKPLAASNITAAAMFRSIEKWQPTLLVDEADSFIRDNEELRGVVDSGHSRPQAFVIRNVIRNKGDDYDPTRFSTWCAKVIALIGKLKATMQDRAIVIPMRRKLPGEKIAGRSSEDAPRSLALRQRCARWGADNLERLRHQDAQTPAGLNDRAADNWSALLAIADLAGGDWPARARAAAMALSGGEAEAESTRSLLLADIRTIFEEIDADRITSADLTNKLAAMIDRPWPEWRNGKPITQRQLAGLLAPVDVTPKTIRAGEDRGKGYMLASFDDPFARYLPQRSVTTGQPAASLGLSPKPIRDNAPHVTDRKSAERGGQLGLSRCHGSEEGDGGEGMPEPLGLPERIDADLDGDDTDEFSL